MATFLVAFVFIAEVPPNIPFVDSAAPRSIHL
jgi:hypothetical protein